MLNQIFIAESFAQNTQTNSLTDSTEFSFASFVPLVLIFAVFYFLIVRPQSKKAKEHQNMVNNLKTGNKVITSSGIIGVVTDILQKENQVEIEIANDVKVKVLRNYVIDLLKTEEKKKDKK
jgi:preprotein translocase subunit YajC